MSALIVDTHHWRVAKKLGLLLHDTPLDKAAICLERQIPNCWSPADWENHHFMMRQIGLDFCAASRQKCLNCPLRDICAHGQTDAH